MNSELHLYFLRGSNPVTFRQPVDPGFCKKIMEDYTDFSQIIVSSPQGIVRQLGGYDIGGVHHKSGIHGVVDPFGVDNSREYRHMMQLLEHFDIPFLALSRDQNSEGLFRNWMYEHFR